jgi:hypothetical protein
MGEGLGELPEPSLNSRSLAITPESHVNHT